MQYNLIGSHDTPRARTVLAGDVAALRLATLLLLTLPGAPSLYYGDELAMEGGPDPDCRRALPVEPAVDALAHRAFVRALIRARREHAALRRGEAHVLGADALAVVIGREADGERAIVAVNAGRTGTRIAIDAAGPFTDARWRREPVPLPVIATGRLVDASTIELPPQSALILA